MDSLSIYLRSRWFKLGILIILLILVGVLIRNLVGPRTVQLEVVPVYVPVDTLKLKPVTKKESRLQTQWDSLARLNP